MSSRAALVVRSSPLSALAATLLSVAPAAQSAVHVVDVAAGPGSDFTSLEAARLAAADGDVLLVRGGFYDETLLLGTKSLTVVAEDGFSVRLRGLEITGLAADDHVLLRGLTTEGTSAPALVASANAGAVWLEDCVLRGPEGFGNLAGGVELDGCAHVVFSRCLLERALVPSGLAEATLAATASGLVLHETEVRGPADTGAALALHDASAELTGSSLLGGDGFDGIALFCDGQDGGTGLRATGSSSVERRDSVVSGGAGGQGFGSCDDGLDGPAVEAAPGALVPLAQDARSYGVPSPLREGQPLRVRLEGRANDLVWLLVDLAPSAGLTPAFLDGLLLVGSTPQVVFYGALPASGVEERDFLAPDLGPGVEATAFVSQAVFREAGTGVFRASSPTLVTVLDAAL